MRSLTVTLLLFLSVLTGHAQIASEQTYTDQAVHFVELESAGSYYYVIDEMNNQLHFYDKHHQLWKTLPMPVPLGATLKKISHVSQEIFEPMSGIEYVMTYQLNGVYEAQVMDENGNVLFHTNLGSSVDVWEVDGQNKLVVSNASGWNPTGTTEVHDVYSFSLEHSYTGVLGLKDFAYSGQRYYVMQTSSTGNWVEFFDTDHTFLTSIVLAPIFSGQIYDVSFSQAIINPDSLIEVIYIEPGQAPTGWVVNELGQTLATFTDCLSLEVVELAGQHWLQRGNPVGSYDLLDLSTYTVQHTFVNGIVKPVETENLPNRYYLVDYAGESMEMYDQNLQLTQTVNFDVAPGGDFGDAFYLSEQVIVPDVHWEAAFTRSAPGATEFDLVFIEHNGLELIEIEDVIRHEVVNFTGEWKLLVEYPNQQSEVFSLGFSSSSIDEATAFDVEVYPNPSPGIVRIETTEAQRVESIRVLDLNGREVHRAPWNGQTTLDLSALPSGLYVLQLQGSDLQHNHKLILE